MTESADALLREILAEVRGLRAIAAALREERPGRRLSAADEVLLQQVLPAIQRSVECRTFSVRMLQEHAELETEDARALRLSIQTAGGPLRLGRLLGRAGGHEIAGFLITEIGASREGMLRTITTVHRNPRAGD